jgi:hypothetical protein
MKPPITMPLNRRKVRTLVRSWLPSHEKYVHHSIDSMLKAEIDKLVEGRYLDDGSKLLDMLLSNNPESIDLGVRVLTDLRNKRLEELSSKTKIKRWKE